jgi:hypothetical protein
MEHRKRYAYVVMNRANTSIESVNVKREKLLAALRSNLEKHKADYATAMEGYGEAKAQKLAALADAANAAVKDNCEENREVVHEAYRGFNNLIRPCDHSESYELAIEIMEWETEDEIELSINDFQCYVRDKWDWKEAFVGSVVTYANHTLTTT